METLALLDQSRAVGRWLSRKRRVVERKSATVLLFNMYTSSRLAPQFSRPSLEPVEDFQKKLFFSWNSCCDAYQRPTGSWDSY